LAARTAMELSTSPTKETPQERGRRVYALDAWRAALLLLGLVLHSMSEIVGRMEENWIQALMLRAVDLIHTFRMPAFFLLSGYLGALLYELRGFRSFLLNRFLRIVVPFCIFIPLIGGLLAFLGLLEQNVYTFQSDPLARSLTLSVYLHPWWLKNLNHLWFLWHLILILSVFLFVWPVVCRYRDAGFLVAIRNFAQSPLLLGGSALALTIAYGFAFRWDSLPFDSTWIPRLDLLGFYGGAFGFGALAHLASTRLNDLQTYWGFPFLLGIVAVIFRFFDSKNGRVFPWNDNGMLFEGYVVTQAVACVGLTMGSLGAFLKWCSLESRLWRYLSDSAYWVYLIHLPFALHLPSLWQKLGVSLEFYPLLTLSATLLICYGSYAVLVRTTALGIMLNGRRYPSQLPLRWAWVLGGGLVMALWAHGLQTDHEIALAERSLGGALHCLPPSLIIHEGSRVFGDPEHDDCIPVGDRYACLELTTFDEGKCQASGGSLYTPIELADDLALVKVLASGPRLDYWTALSDRDEEGTWLAPDGSPLTLNHWAPGEPNDYGGWEDCTEILRDPSPGEHLNDLSCDSPNASVCDWSRLDDNAANSHSTQAFRIVPDSATLSQCRASFGFADRGLLSKSLYAFVGPGLAALRVYIEEREMRPIGRFDASNGQMDHASGRSTSDYPNRRSHWPEESCEWTDGASGVLHLSCGSGRWTLVPE